MPGVYECWKRALDFLELKLAMLVNYYVGTISAPNSNLFLQFSLLFVLAGLELLCRSGWPHTHRDLLASACSPEYFKILLCLF